MTSNKTPLGDVAASALEPDDVIVLPDGPEAVVIEVDLRYPGETRLRVQSGPNGLDRDALSVSDSQTVHRVRGVPGHLRVARRRMLTLSPAVRSAARDVLASPPGDWGQTKQAQHTLADLLTGTDMTPDEAVAMVQAAYPDQIHPDRRT